MIKLFPSDRETIVVIHNYDVIRERISETLQRRPLINSRYTITGWLKDDKFLLHLAMRRLNWFMPAVAGKIDPTSKGCLVFLEYKLLPATTVFLIFWGILILIAGVVTTYRSQNIFMLMGAVLLIALLTLIVRSYFNLHIKATRSVIMELFN